MPDDRICELLVGKQLVRADRIARDRDEIALLESAV